MIIDIANNVRSVEIIKVEILQNITNLFGAIISEPDEETNNRVSNDAANIITLTYILCRRLGIDYKIVNEKMKIKLEKSISESHNLEKKFGDLTHLLNHLNSEEF